MNTLDKQIGDPRSVALQAGMGANLKAGLARLLPSFLLFAAMLVIWEGVARGFKLPEFVLPAPTSIIRVLIDRQGPLSFAAWVTAKEVLFGFVLSAIVGAAVALVIARFAAFGRALYPLVVLFQIPNSLPYLMAGLKVAVTLAVIGAIVGEFAGAQAGLGYMIQFASTQMETALVFAALVEVSVLGLLFYYVIEFIEWRYVDWVPRAD